MHIKKRQQITWHDLPKIELPFFALSKVLSAVSDDRPDEIFGLSNILLGMRERTKEARLRKLEEDLEWGEVYLLVERPLSPMFQWVEPEGGRKQGEARDIRIITDDFCATTLYERLRYPASSFLNLKGRNRPDPDTYSDNFVPLPDKTAEPIQNSNWLGLHYRHVDQTPIEGHPYQVTDSAGGSNTKAGWTPRARRFSIACRLARLR